MATFTVTQIIDGDTFVVSPNWNWNGQVGNRVRPAGYDTPELGQPGASAAAARLGRLILQRQVDLGSAYRIDHGRVVCEVFFQGRNLKDFFPVYRS